MSVIYEPKGRAKEYSLLACNLFTGCVHGCKYCYAPRALHVTPEQFRVNVKPRKDIIKRLSKNAEKYSGTDMRVLLCFTCDPYQPKEIEQGVTREALEVLREFDIPFQILTKGGMRAVRDFDLYGPNDAFATTLTLTKFVNEIKFEVSNYVDNVSCSYITHKSAFIFSHFDGLAGFHNRCEAIKEAHAKHITTWVSLEPVIIAQESLDIIEATHHIVDLYKIGKMNYQPCSIDWRDFGIKAIKLCKRYRKPYYIKDDLAKYLKGVKFTNIDTRRIMREATS